MHLSLSLCPKHKKEIQDLNPTIKLFGQNIPIVAEATFLGVIFDTRLTWGPQFSKMTAKAYKRLNILRHLASLTKKPNPNTLLHLYKSIMRPIFEYASLCYINAADVHFDKIQLIQNHALRIVMQSPRYTLITDLHDCTGSQPIKTHLISDAKHRLQIMQNNSPLIHKVILEYHAHQHIPENASPLDVLGNQR